MKRLVLLSGGLDSVAALHWSIEQGGPVSAVGFSYAQPHRDAELTAAAIIATRRGVPFDVVILPELPRLNPTAGRDAAGVSLAFVPGRNALFLTRAAMHAARPGEDFVLVMGANADDFAAFPDCRGAFFDAARAMLRSSLVGVCGASLQTPWVNCTKAMILRWCLARADALADVRESVSCYRGARCSTCDACTLRARAFAEVGIDDGASVTAMHGGDPQREARLRQP